MKEYFQNINEEGLIVSFTSEAKDLAGIELVNNLGINTVILDCQQAYTASSLKQTNNKLIVGISCLKHGDHFQAEDNNADFVILPCWDLSDAKYYQNNDIDVIPYCETENDIARLYDSYQYFVINFNSSIENKFKDRFFIINTVYPKDITDTGLLNNVLAYVVSGSTATLDNARNVRFAIRALLDVHIAHIGINAADETESWNLANQFNTLFYGNVCETLSANFGSRFVEVMKGNGRGSNGHIGIGVNNVTRAVKYYTSMGYQFDYSSASYDELGNLTLIYFIGEIAGFAVHLVQ